MTHHRSLGRDLAAVLPPALAVGTLGGLILGLVRGWHSLAAGYPLLLADSLRREGLWGLSAGAVFALLFAATAALGRRRWPEPLVTPVAAAVAALPLVAAGGYRLDLELGLRPSRLFEARALKLNLLYLALCLLAYAAVWLFLRRRRGWGRRGVLAAVAALASLGLLHALVSRGFQNGGGAREADHPNVLLILVDALRADHLSSYGYHRPTTPAMDALAADGVLFRQAITSSTFTKTSIASLFTGRHPFQHGVYWGNLEDEPGHVTSDLLAAGEVTLAERLRQAGYLTTAWVQNTHLQRFMGFGQGFVDYHDQQGGIARINPRFRRFLRGAGRRYPFFAYLHYIDLHDPYRPEPPYDGLFGNGDGDPYAGVDLDEWGAYLEAVRQGQVTLSPQQVSRLEDLYDGQIRYVDDRLGRLLGFLEEQGLYEDSLILLTADHGDAFYEHGVISHSSTPYEELVRVPLIVKLPRGRHAGRVVSEPVRLIDVMPTLLTEVGAPVPPQMAGCPLQPLLDGGGEGRDPRCGEAVIEIAEDGAYPVVAVRAGGFKYIHHQKAGDELYDLTRDPGEQHNLVHDGLPVTEPLRQRALEVVAARGSLAHQRIELDEKTIRELKALGYID